MIGHLAHFLLGLFWSNLHTKDLEMCARTCSDQSFLDEGAIVTPVIGLVLGGHVPRLNHGPI